MNLVQGLEGLLKELGAFPTHGNDSHGASHVEHTNHGLVRQDSVEVSSGSQKMDDEHLFHAHKKSETFSEVKPLTDSEPDMNRSKKAVLKLLLPYIGVFVFAFLFYFVFFTNFSIKNFFHFKLTPQVEQKTQSYENLEQYNTWIKSYYFAVNDQKILAPDYDISGNGLTNYQKFILGLNPKKIDTLGLGLADTQSILNGINPATGNSYSEEQKKLIAQYVDLEAAANKLSLDAARRAAQVAGVNTNGENRIDFTINQTIPGTLELPSIGVKVPLIWTQDVKNFDQDLQNGVIHYPGTPLPGEMGTAYISGHSSNYSWAKGSYNKIFEKLGDVKKYDSFSIAITTTAGKQVVLHYVVDASGIFNASDQAQFANVGRASVALSTCWPIGTSQKRLVLFGALSQIDK